MAHDRAVIADADRSLAAYLGASLPKGTAVSFETPDADFAESVKRPTVSCFLHRVVEDTTRRVADVVELRNSDGRVEARQAPVRHYQLHYLVSAWAGSVSDEHDLLSAVMSVGLGGETLPPAHLQGVLDGEEEPVLLRIAVPVADNGPDAHDLWSSLGVPIKASLALVLVAPLRPALDTDIAEPAESITVGMEAIDAQSRLAEDASRALLSRKWTKIVIKERP